MQWIRHPLEGAEANFLKKLEEEEEEEEEERKQEVGMELL
jgi:hypothetical protein